MFRVDLLKSNKKYIAISFIGILLFAVINLLINPNVIFSSLGENNSKINKLIINELMSSNSGSLIDEKGYPCDWLEIYNGYNTSINLKNYGLSDEISGRIKWLFPDVEINSKEYLIVFLNNDSLTSSKVNLHAPFSLKQSGGEYVTLKKPNGKIVDSVKTISLEKNTSMARDEKGKWIVTKEITPGYENTTLGREHYLLNSNHQDISSSLVLTEFLPTDEGNIIFLDNKLHSYIEVTNIGEKPISLKDYYLSNSEEVIYKWRLPDIELKKEESYLVYTDGEKGINHASFRLKHKTGNVILATYTGIIENVRYSELPNGVAYIKENNKWLQNTNISPGYSNTDTGKIQFHKELDIPKKDIIITEVMSSNNSYLAQNGNQFYDWIELYNNSNHDIQLSEYTLTTDYEDKTMFSLPNKLLSPGNYYILMASGNQKLSNDFYKHTNFKLSSGKGLFLLKDSNIVDSLYIYSIPKGYSYGRDLMNGHYYYTDPTPMTINSSLALKRVDTEPKFSKEGGIYNDVLSIELENFAYNDIYYTLDGNVPTTSSLHYNGPITIHKTTVIRAATYRDGVRVSDVITNSYIMNENHTLPVMSISIPPSSFNSVYYNSYGEESYPAHVDFYENNSSFSIDCNLKLSGSSSRELIKKSFALKFDYGNLHYKVFDDKNLLEFNALVLRSGSQDQNNAMMRDEFATTLAIKYGTLDAQATKPAVLYINGNYWGIYYIREKINKNFIEDNHNVAGNTNITWYNYQTEEGSNDSMVQLHNYIANHNLKEKTYYNHVTNLLDIDNYIDFWVFQYIVNNTDIHNYRYYNNPNINNGKIRMILFDLDYSMYYARGSSYLDYIQNPDDSQSFLNTTIIRGLMNNDTFRKRFIERTAYYLKNVWTKENIEKEYNSLYTSINPEMNRNCMRWNQNYYQWNYYASQIKSFAIKRISQIPNEIKIYFGLSQEEINEYFG